MLAFDYTDMTKYIFMFMIPLIESLLLGYLLIPFLRKLKFGQSIRDEGPNWHKKKSGTPTMGGFIFILSTVITIAIFSREKQLWLMLGICVGFSAIGFIDDYIKVILKRNLGLTSIQKAALQVVFATAYVVAMYKMGYLSTEIILPFTSITLNLQWIIVPFSVFVMVGFVNAVNLTDGLDGLATSVTIVVALFFAIAAIIYKSSSSVILSLCVAGGLCGFLMYNKYPAKVFMGDTGSLFLGGFVSTVAIALKMPIILIIVGLVYVIETGSVMLQVGSYKLTKKRIFKMAPIHHHFEMCGWSEAKIVVVSSILTLACCVIGYFAI